MVKYKVCPKCNQEKEASKFYKNKQSKSGLRSYCKECEKIVNSDREYKYKETRKKYRATDNYRKIKQDYYKNNTTMILDSNRI